MAYTKNKCLGHHKSTAILILTAKESFKISSWLCIQKNHCEAFSSSFSVPLHLRKLALIIKSLLKNTINIGFVCQCFSFINMKHLKFLLPSDF